jgi:hypothetical protein
MKGTELVESNTGFLTLPLFVFEVLPSIRDLISFAQCFRLFALSALPRMRKKGLPRDGDDKIIMTHVRTRLLV